MSQRTLPFWPIFVTTLTPPAFAAALAFTDGVGDIVTIAIAVCAAFSTALIFTYDSVVPPTKTTAARYTKIAMLAINGAVILLAAFWIGQQGGALVASLGIIGIAFGLCAYFLRSALTTIRSLATILLFLITGPTAVSALYFVQSREMNPAVALAGCAAGLWVVLQKILSDIYTADTKHQTYPYTDITKDDITAAKRGYLFILMTTFVLPVGLYIYMQDHLFIIATSILCVASIPHLLHLIAATTAEHYRRAMTTHLWLQIVYIILFSVGWYF